MARVRFDRCCFDRCCRVEGKAVVQKVFVMGCESSKGKMEDECGENTDRPLSPKSPQQEHELPPDQTPSMGTATAPQASQGLQPCAIKVTPTQTHTQAPAASPRNPQSFHLDEAAPKMPPDAEQTSFTLNEQSFNAGSTGEAPPH